MRDITAAKEVPYFIVLVTYGPAEVTCGPTKEVSRSPVLLFFDHFLGASYSLKNKAEPARRIMTSACWHTDRTTTTGKLQARTKVSMQCCTLSPYKSYRRLSVEEEAMFLVNMNLLAWIHSCPAFRCHRINQRQAYLFSEFVDVVSSSYQQVFFFFEISFLVVMFGRQVFAHGKTLLDSQFG
jgi:hypothetical protein